MSTRLAPKAFGFRMQVFGQRVDITPVYVVLPVLQHGQIYPRETFPDAGIMRSVTAVPTDVHLTPRRFYQKKTPTRYG